jgi:hypothetical protein
MMGLVAFGLATGTAADRKAVEVIQKMIAG